jgi:hypothetical protein
LHWPGLQHGVAAAGRRGPRKTSFASKLAHHDSPAQRRCTRKFLPGALVLWQLIKKIWFFPFSLLASFLGVIFFFFFRFEQPGSSIRHRNSSYRDFTLTQAAQQFVCHPYGSRACCSRAEHGTRQFHVRFRGCQLRPHRPHHNKTRPA